MAVTIVQKGDTVVLKGKNTVTKAMLGIGWDVNEGQSQFDFDADASLVFRSADGVAQDVLYYAQLTLPYATHSGDNRTGAGAGDDEQVHVDLSAVPSNITFVDAVVTIYQAKANGQHFGMMESAFARLVNDDTGVELVRTDLTNEPSYFGMTSLHLARFVRSGPTWDFVAVQKGLDLDLPGITSAVWPTV